MARSGYVLVGGRSRRMGRDKALLPFRGSTLSGAIAEAVAAAAGSAILVGNRHLGGIADRYPGEGPLGGILTALEHTSTEWNLIVACDMPQVTSALLERLLRAAEVRDCDALLPREAGGRLQPLCAVYRLSARTALQPRFESGVRKVTDALDGLHMETVDMAEAFYFQNVNTPQDWAEYAAG